MEKNEKKFYFKKQFVKSKKEIVFIFGLLQKLNRE